MVIVAGGVAVGAALRGGQEQEPGPPSTSRTSSVTRIPTSAPKVPFVVNQRLYVDGEQVPGAWWSVDAGDAGWVAHRRDDTWWWGRGPKPNQITGYHDVAPVISLNGRYVAEIHKENGAGVLTALDTRKGGEGLGRLPVDVGRERTAALCTSALSRTTAR